MTHPTIRKLLSALCLCFLFCDLSAQETSFNLHILSGTISSEAYSQQELSRIKKRLQADLEENLFDNRRKREAYQSLLEERAQVLSNQIYNQELLFDPQLQNIIQEVSDVIYQANPSLPKSEISFWISRSGVPNASCYGEGTIILNAGLIAQLTSVDELAFTMCHEIAHYLKEHVNKSITEKFDYFFSEEFEEEMKKISKSEFNRLSQLRELMEGFAYQRGRHSREHELEADSLGFALLRRTPFQSQGAIRVLTLLDEIDEESPDDYADLKSVFDHPEFPFKNTWTLDEDGGFIMGSRASWWEIDSLKTHPDCKKRIAVLSPYIEKQTAQLNSLVPQFPYLKSSLTFEIVEYFHDIGNYGLCIHAARRLLKQYPQNAYLHSRISLSLLYIWQAQLNHEKGKVVQQSSPRFTEAYTETLRMLNKMRLSELKGLTINYTDRHSNQFGQDEHFLFAMIKCAELDQRSNWVSLKEDYRKRYPDGLYIHEIQ